MPFFGPGMPYKLHKKEQMLAYSLAVLSVILFAGVTNGLGLIVWYIAVERAAF